MKRVKCIIATDEVIPKYGIRLHRIALESLADQIRRDGLPLRLEHDQTQRLQAPVIDASVRKLNDDEAYGVFVEYELSDEDFDRFGGRTGASVGFMVPHIPFEDLPSKPSIFIGFDPAFYTDEEIERAMRSSSELANYGSGRHYQLTGVLDVAKLVFEFAATVPMAVITSAIYDVAKNIFLQHRRNKPASQYDNVVELHSLVVSEDGRILRRNTAVIKSSDPEIVLAGIQAYEHSNASQLEITAYDIESAEFRAVGSPTCGSRQRIKKATKQKSRDDDRDDA